MPDQLAFSRGILMDVPDHANPATKLPNFLYKTLLQSVGKSLIFVARACRDLFSRPWFSRKWIIQEFVGGKAVDMICGPSTFNFELLQNAYSLCLQHGLHKILCPDTQEGLVVTKQHPFYTMLVIKDLVRHHFDIEDSWGRMTLPWLLVNTHYAKVTNAHDAIYSLLGVFTLFGSLGGLPYPLIDYSRPVQEVYAAYTSSIDWAHDPFSLLEIAGQPKKIKGLPSWVPDWSYSSLRIPLGQRDREREYCASRTTDRLGFKFNPEGTVLYGRGGLADVIANPAKAIWDHEESNSETDEVMLNLNRQFNELTGQISDYPTHEKMSDVLCKTLTGNVQTLHDGTPTNYSKIIEVYKAYLEDSARGGQAGVRDNNPDETNTPAILRPFITAAREVCCTRKFCLTAKGYVGQVPSEALSGDRICIILGEKVPFIIRHEGTSWRLIGAAYVHGIMQGEGLQHLDDGIREIALI
jgi:hypothetical protein